MSVPLASVMLPKLTPSSEPCTLYFPSVPVGAALMVHGVGHAQQADRESDGETAASDSVITLIERKREDGILVNASRTRVAIYSENYTGSATIIEARMLEQRQARDIADRLAPRASAHEYDPQRERHRLELASRVDGLSCGGLDDLPG
jgi:hypothetical protein